MLVCNLVPASRCYNNGLMPQISLQLGVWAAEELSSGAMASLFPLGNGQLCTETSLVQQILLRWLLWMWGCVPVSRWSDARMRRGDPPQFEAPTWSGGSDLVSGAEGRLTLGWMGPRKRRRIKCERLRSCESFGRFFFFFFWKRRSLKIKSFLCWVLLLLLKMFVWSLSSPLPLHS